jgi:integrase
MATYRKYKSTWRVEVYRKGVRRSAAGFSTKAAAVAWASRVEAEIIGGSKGEIPDLPFSDLLDRYKRDVSPLKKGHRWEAIRIALIKRQKLSSVRLRSLNTTHVAQWRDERLKSVSAASVRREWNLLSHACDIAMREWKWLRSNPFREIRRPPSSRPRDRIFTDADLKALADKAETALQQEVLRCVRFAIETAMRAGEIFRCEVRGRVAYLTDTKNGMARQVPLSEEAVRLYGNGWTLKPSTLDVHWRALRDASGLSGFRFHDTRHTAITRLAKKLNPFELARMTGHKDLKMLLSYYNESADEIARKL